MRRLSIARLAILVFALAALAALAPSAQAAEPQPTGSYNISYYNYIDEGGAWCASWAPIPGGSETDINHFWPEWTRPFPGVNVNNYMACWDGVLTFPVGGKWTVHTVNDDGMDVYVDNVLVMHGWYDQGPSLHDGSIDLGAGAHHVIVKYYNRTLGGTACVAWGLYGNPIPWWQCPNNQTRVVAAPSPALPTSITIIIQGLPTLGVPGRVCTYRVQWGDNLTRIAMRYHTTVWALMLANHISNPNLIYAGQLLRIPNCY